MNKNIFKIEDGVLVDVLDKSITEAVIPDSVSHIGSSVFLGCISLTSIKHLAHYDFEDEILVSRKARWAISKVEKTDDITHIFVSELER